MATDILIVTADNAEHSALREILSELGHTVHSAHCARDAWDRLQERPALVLVDKGLPDVDGLELLRQLRSRVEFRQLPVIVVSDEASDRELADTIERGAQDYIVKPFSPKVVASRVAMVLRNCQLQERMIESKRRYQLAITAARCGLWDWNIREDRMYLTQPLQDLLRLSGPLPSTMADWLGLIHKEDRDRVRSRIEAYVARGEGELDLEYRIPHPTDGIRWYLCRGRLCRNGIFEPVRLLGALAEITERRRAEIALATSHRELANARDELARQARQLEAHNEALRKAARIDALTGLLNRSGFHEMLEAEWSRARRYHRPLSCVMIDIDYFKQVNDIHGHIIGDKMIADVGRLIGRESRESDHVCRHGGEEFCVLLTETNLHGATGWAERMCHKVAETHFEAKDATLRLTISLGVAELSVWHHSPDHMLDSADQALLLAKRSGRNRVVVSTRLACGQHEHGLEAGNLLAMEGVLARDVMEPLRHIARASDTILSVSRLLRKHDLASVPVVDEDGKLVGIVSEKDIVVVPIHASSWNRPVREIMTDKAVSYPPDALANNILRFLQRVPIRCALVVRDGKPEGIVSRSTFLDWVHNHAMAAWPDISEPTPPSAPLSIVAPPAGHNCPVPP